MPSLEAESRQTSSTCSNTCSKDRVRHGNSGGYFKARLRTGFSFFGPQLQATDRSLVFENRVKLHSPFVIHSLFRLRVSSEQPATLVSDIVFALRHACLCAVLKQTSPYGILIVLFRLDDSSNSVADLSFSFKCLIIKQMRAGIH